MASVSKKKKEINTFNQQGCIKLIKSDGQLFDIVTIKIIF